MEFSISDALWLFVILSMPQPMLARKLIDMRRLSMSSQIG